MFVYCDQKATLNYIFSVLFYCYIVFPFLRDCKCELAYNLVQHINVYV